MNLGKEWDPLGVVLCLVCVSCPQAHKVFISCVLGSATCTFEFLSCLRMNEKGDQRPFLEICFIKIKAERHTESIFPFASTKLNFSFLNVPVGGFCNSSYFACSLCDSFSDWSYTCFIFKEGNQQSIRLHRFFFSLSLHFLFFFLLFLAFLPD